MEPVTAATQPHRLVVDHPLEELDPEEDLDEFEKTLIEDDDSGSSQEIYNI